MNSTIASLLKSLVEGVPAADKVAGLVRAVQFNQKTPDGKTVVKTLPLACDFTDPNACTDLEVTNLVPDGNKRSIVYFEDLGWTRSNVKLPRAVQYVSRLRMVVWMNTKMIGDQCSSGVSVQQDFVNAVQVEPYSDGDVLSISHRVYNVPPVSNGIFSKYSYAEAERQYLTWPFDYFALDIETKFVVQDGCKIPLTPVPQPC